MRILVTGITGYVGAALAPRLLAAGHEVVGYARDPSRVTLDVPVVAGDAVAGTGLDEAFDGARVAYYLIHSMEPGDQGFDVRDRAAAGKSLDIAGPDVLTYGEVVERIAEHLLVGRAPVRLPFNATPLASRVAATIAGEDHALIGPLMESLEGDLLPRDMRAPELLGVRLHTFDAAVERALRDMEQLGEPLVAR